MMQVTRFFIFSSSLVNGVGVHANLFALAAPDLVCPSALSALNDPPSEGLMIFNDTTYKAVPLAGTTASLMLSPEMNPLPVTHWEVVDDVMVPWPKIAVPD
jgi:hypothetical protein